MEVIAIDGPAGAGKSTIASSLARALGWRYVDTGAMYRAVALAAIERGVTPEETRALEKLASQLDIRVDERSVTVEGVDVTTRIRDDDVTGLVSDVAAIPGVRAAMLTHQRAVAAGGRVVMEGRDIGSVVVPEAELKVFLTASIAERARRRSRELGLQNDETDVLHVGEAMAARDEADSTRRASPLVQPPDAMVVDSTDKTVAEVVAEIVAAARGVVSGVT